MNSQKQKPAIPWPLIILFLALSAGELVVGLLYYRHQRTHMLNDSKQELSAIANLMVRTLTQWRNERINDGNSLRENMSVYTRFSEYVNNQNDSKLRNELTRNLQALVDNYDYASAIFLDSDFLVRLNYPEKDSIIEIGRASCRERV